MKKIDLSGVNPQEEKEQFINPYEALKPYEGKTLKYREVCDIVGEEYKSGGGRLQCQINRWMKYVDIDKQGRGKYFINHVYITEQELGILKSYGKYTRYIEQYLMAKFYAIRLNEDSDKIVLTNREILEETCAVNHKYFKGRQNPMPYIAHFDTGLKKTDLPNEYYEQDFLLEQSNLFFSGSYRLLKRVVYDSLKILEKKSLIIPNKTFRLYKNEWVQYGDNKVWHSEAHDCNEDEVAKILRIQHDSVEEFNLRVPRDKYGHPKYYLRNIAGLHYLYKEQREEYKAIEHRRLVEEFKVEGWNSYSMAWSINLAKAEAIEYELKKEYSYMGFNQLIQDKMLSSKELDIITEGLRRQFVEEFIKG